MKNTNILRKLEILNIIYAEFKLSLKNLIIGTYKWRASMLTVHIFGVKCAYIKDGEPSESISFSNVILLILHHCNLSLRPYTLYISQIGNIWAIWWLVRQSEIFIRRFQLSISSSCKREIGLEPWLVGRPEVSVKSKKSWLGRSCSYLACSE